MTEHLPHDPYMADEMPDSWVRALDVAIETLGWEVHDAHESAIVMRLTAGTRPPVGADSADQYVIVGWDENGAHWGLSEDAATIDHPRPLGGDTPALIAARLDQVLRTGRPEPRPLRHAIPYAEVSSSCPCPVVYPCGGIVPAGTCPEHGDRRTPAMAWHWEANCPPTLAAPTP